jgi:hypothetical protein
VSLVLIVLLVWASIAFAVMVAGYMITSDSQPTRYVTLTVIKEPSAENVDGDEREAA